MTGLVITSTPHGLEQRSLDRLRTNGFSPFVVSLSNHGNWPLDRLLVHDPAMVS
jgi:hypothetical protein